MVWATPNPQGSSFKRKPQMNFIKSWNSRTIRIRADRYVNLTDVGQASNKNINDWFRQKSTKSYLDTLSAITGIPVMAQGQDVQALVEIAKGGGNPEKMGTWAHPKVAIRFAQWCSDELAVQVDSWVDELLTKGYVSLDNSSKPPTIASWYSRVMLFHQKNNIPIGYWSIFEQTINLVAKLEEFGYALPEGKILDISIGKCWAAHLRNELKINPDNVAQKYRHYYPGWAHPVEANIYPVSLLIPFQEWLQRIYKPIRLPAYFKKADPTALPAVEKMIKALPGR